MRLRVLLTFVGLALALFAVTPAYADDHWINVSGTFWIDENVDGIRQPSEPVASGGDGAHGRPIADGGTNSIVRFDDEGNFRYPWAYPRARFAVWNYHTRPGDSVYLFRSGTYGYSHFGKACFYVPPGSTELTLEIRLLHHSTDPSAPPKNWPLANGHFFKETSGELYRGCDSGFAVTNAGGIALWDTWQRLGLESVGYPISHRFMWRGFVTQAFQKAIVQWRPGRGVYFVKVFDELHAAGYDDELRRRWSIPRRLGSLEPALPVHIQGELREKLREEIHRRRLALLDANPAIKERYYAAPDPLLQYGLPTSRVEDMGNHYAIRTQRTVFQQWKEDVPWAKAGEVTIANGGDIARALDATCDHSDTSRRCTHLFFSEEPLENQHPVALIPQHIDLIDLP